MTILDKYNLQRYIDAQERTYERALEEVKNGRKTSHWIWFIFPQYQGLGRSSTSIKYAIKSKEEALAYFQHPILGKRLIEITNAVLEHEDKSAYEIFGSPDDMKLKSSMTLFDAVQNETNIFEDVLDKYFDSKKCQPTLQQLCA